MWANWASSAEWRAGVKGKGLAGFEVQRREEAPEPRAHNEAYLDEKEHGVVSTAWDTTHEKVVEVHEVAHLANDEERCADHHHENVMQPVDEIEIIEKQHVVQMDGEDQRRWPVVDSLVKRERRDGIG